ncbi:50S ribosomal protein L1 [Candidatus Microgenomates bacterium]|nr:50S ribosomal protein L1 [Candidatus Microgenomates bacterium]
MVKEPKKQPQAATAAAAEASVELTPEEILKAKKQEAKLAKQAEPTVAKQPVHKAKLEKSVKKVVSQPVRSRLERRGKKYQAVAKLIEPGKTYTVSEAAQLIPKIATAKFDGSVELHINLNVDPKQADQMVRGTTALPHGTGKNQRVAVLAADTKQQTAAKAAGADVIGHEDLLAKIEKGVFEFDILVTTPDQMAQLGKHAKLLGPKGLMPNPKSGTVTTDITKTVKELKAGRVEFRVDPAGIIHQVIGKVSFKPEQIAENLHGLLKAIQAARPTSIKGTYIERVSLTTTMGPSLRLDLADSLKS